MKVNINSEGFKRALRSGGRIVSDGKTHYPPTKQSSGKYSRKLIKALCLARVAKR